MIRSFLPVMRWAGIVAAALFGLAFFTTADGSPRAVLAPQRTLRLPARQGGRVDPGGEAVPARLAVVPGGARCEVALYSCTRTSVGADQAGMISQAHGPNCDPPASPSGEPSPLSESIARGFDSLENEITGDLAQITKHRQLVQRLRRSWEASNGSVASMLTDAAVNKLKHKYPQSAALIEKLSADASRQKSAGAAGLERAIRDFCGEIGRTCQGRYPRITVAHFIEVSVDESARRTKVGATSVQSLDWAKIRSSLEKEIARVWGRAFDAPAFRDKILEAYDALEARRGPTGYVRLDDVFKEVRARRAADDPQARSGGRLSAYYRDEFSADLSKLWESQVSGGLPAPLLEFTSIRQADQGFSVVLPGGDLATYGFVKPHEALA